MAQNKKGNVKVMALRKIKMTPARDPKQRSNLDKTSLLKHPAALPAVEAAM